jgi:excisionase family DNA binding protein
MITERELAHLLRCDPRTVRRLEVSGELPPALRIGGSKRWQRQVIEDWLEQMQRERAG